MSVEVRMLKTRLAPEGQWVKGKKYWVTSESAKLLLRHNHAVIVSGEIEKKVELVSKPPAKEAPAKVDLKADDKEKTPAKTKKTDSK